jgi:hypothetical protein
MQARASGRYLKISALCNIPLLLGGTMAFSKERLLQYIFFLFFLRWLIKNCKRKGLVCYLLNLKKNILKIFLV